MSCKHHNSSRKQLHNLPPSFVFIFHCFKERKKLYFSENKEAIHLIWCRNRFNGIPWWKNSAVKEGLSQINCSISGKTPSPLWIRLNWNSFSGLLLKDFECSLQVIWIMCGVVSGLFRKINLIYWCVLPNKQFLCVMICIDAVYKTYLFYYHGQTSLKMP